MLAPSVYVLALTFLIGLFTPLANANGPTDGAHIHPGRIQTTPIGWAQFCKEQPTECRAARGAQYVSVTRDKLQELRSINLRFNRSIVPLSDQEQFGMAEYWTYASTGKGDCEDYVLEKRRALVALGWPANALLITVVLDKKMAGHAVLTVVTDRGDMILDNVVDEVLPWSATGLTFIKRQSPDNPNEWVDLGRATATRELATATTIR